VPALLFILHTIYTYKKECKFTVENQNSELTPIIIDLSSSDRLDESFLRTMGFGIKAILGRMFGGSAMPVTVKGNSSDVRSFSQAVGREKRYMDSYKRYGLDNPKTYKSKYKLDKSIKDFTRKTGIKWPFK
jgi:hypothetical protein